LKPTDNKFKQIRVPEVRFLGEQDGPPEHHQASGKPRPADGVVYCAFTQEFEPTSLTETSEKKTRSGLPFNVPWRLSETRRGPAFL
jgi:hypothetical protein